MINKNFNFTYNIKNINIEQGTFEITYIPDDSNLTTITLNQFLMYMDYRNILNGEGDPIYDSQDSVPFKYHLEHTINMTKPFHTWNRQFDLIENIDTLVNCIGHMTVDNATQLATKDN